MLKTMTTDPLEYATTTACSEAIAPALPRAVGTLRMSTQADAGRTRIATLYQAGSSKLLLPRTGDPGLTGIILNSAGGLTGGDRFSISAAATQDSALTLATQTAERAYRARPGSVAQVTTKLTAASGATAHWLPQETILFDGCALSRRLEIDLDEDATLLAVEPVILGRAAMGETLHDARFTDHWRVRRAGRLVYADSLRLYGDVAARTLTPATLDGRRAFASVLYAAQDAERRLEPLRSLLPDSGGASLIRPGLLAARLCASDGFTLRRALIPMLELLRDAPLPTVWKM